MQKNAAAISCPKSDIITIFITNLGKYNEGELVGEWIDLPTTHDEIKACFKRIGIDGIKYEEYFLTDYESSIDGITRFINEYSSLDELNYLACKLEELSISEIVHYEAILEMGDYVSSVKDLINLTDNLDCFDILSDVENEYDLGYYWIEESGCYNLSELGNLACYFDYERFGRDIHLDQGGYFTSQGYLYLTNDSFSTDYDGENIPDEYCILCKVEQNFIS